MGRGHQLLEELFLASACLGGPFVGYGSFFALQVIAVSLFWAYRGCPGLPAALTTGAAGSHPRLPRVRRVPRLADVFPVCILADISCQYFSPLQPRRLYGCCSDKGSALFPRSLQKEAALGLAVTPQEPRELWGYRWGWALGTLFACSLLPSPRVQAGHRLCSGPWCLAGRRPPPRVPSWQLPAQALAAHRPAPGLSGNGAGGEGPPWAQRVP